MAAHYDTAIVPARPFKPRDKAKVEVGVLVATRWIIAKLRKRTFFSLAELKAAIAIEVAALNAQVTRHLGASRKALFEEPEWPELNMATDIGSVDLHGRVQDEILRLEVQRFLIEPQAHDGERAHAVEPSALRRLDAGAPQAECRRDRAEHVGAGRGHPA